VAVVAAADGHEVLASLDAGLGCRRGRVAGACGGAEGGYERAGHDASANDVPGHDGSPAAQPRWFEVNPSEAADGKRVMRGKTPQTARGQIWIFVFPQPDRPSLVENAKIQI
jgi:hypothetical protein